MHPLHHHHQQHHQQSNNHHHHQQSHPSNNNQQSSMASSSTGDLLTRKRRRGMVEKKRRDRINASLNELRRLVPAAFEKQGSAKLEKAEILQMTVDHLRMLHSKGFDTFSFDPHSFAMEYHRTGFHECIKQVEHYLSHYEGMDHHNQLRFRLFTHLSRYATQRESALKLASSATVWNPSAFTTPSSFTPIPVQSSTSSGVSPITANASSSAVGSSTPSALSTASSENITILGSNSTQYNNSSTSTDANNNTVNSTNPNSNNQHNTSTESVSSNSVSSPSLNQQSPIKSPSSPCPPTSSTQLYTPSAYGTPNIQPIPQMSYPTHHHPGYPHPHHPHHPHYPPPPPPPHHTHTHPHPQAHHQYLPAGYPPPSTSFPTPIQDQSQLTAGVKYRRPWGAELAY